MISAFKETKNTRSSRKPADDVEKESIQRAKRRRDVRFKVIYFKAVTWTLQRPLIEYSTKRFF